MNNNYKRNKFVKKNNRNYYALYVKILKHKANPCIIWEKVRSRLS